MGLSFASRAELVTAREGWRSVKSGLTGVPTGSYGSGSPALVPKSTSVEGTGTSTRGTIAVSTGIVSIASRTANQAACRAAPERTRSTTSTRPTAAAAARMRSEMSAASPNITSSYLRFLTLAASLRICAGVSTCSSTIPARNCSAEPDQKRSMICCTDRAARLRGGTDAR